MRRRYIIIAIMFALVLILFIIRESLKNNTIENSEIFSITNTNQSNITQSNTDKTLQEKYSDKNIERTLDKVTMRIKDGTLTKTGATVIIEDNNEVSYVYGNWYRIEKYKWGKWKQLNPIDKNYIEDGIDTIHIR